MGKVQSEKIEKVKSFFFLGVKSLSVGKTTKNYESHFKELNMEKFGEFMFGIRFAFELFGYKAIPDEKGKDSDVFKRAIYNLALENNINLQDYLMGKDIVYYDHQHDKKGKLISVKAKFVKR